jgi:hypothetical protein
MRFTAAAFVIGMSCLPAFAQVPAATPSTELAPAGATANPAAPAQANPPAAATATPATPPVPPEVKDTNIGFSYGLPAGWQTEASAPAKPDVPYPTVEAPKKGNACAQAELTARHGTPFPVVVVVALPFDCYGQSLTNKNMADFTTGASEGLKQTFEVTNTVMNSYSLGNHTMWMERASGTVKGQPEQKYTLEVACTLMTKGAVCWMTMAADEVDLQAFEQEPVTLEGDTFDAIIPSNAITAPTAPAASKPS